MKSISSLTKNGLTSRIYCSYVWYQVLHQCTQIPKDIFLKNFAAEKHNKGFRRKIESIDSNIIQTC